MVLFRDIPPGPYLETSYVLQKICGHGNCLPVEDAGVRYVGGDDTHLKRNGSIRVGLVAQQVKEHVKPGHVKTVGDVGHDVIMPAGPPPLF